MEFYSSGDVLNDGSPSQEDIGSLHPMKLDLSDDFEHITKEVSPKEATAQFLQNETTYAALKYGNNGDNDANDISKFSQVNDSEQQGLETSDFNTWSADSSTLIDQNHTSSETVIPSASSGVIDTDFWNEETGLSKNFMQDERINDDKENESSDHFKEVIPDEKLIETESSTFDDKPVKPADHMISNNAEILKPEALSDAKTSGPTIPSQSSLGFIASENEPNIHSEKIPQGLHVTQNTGLDVSDSEDHVPEPLPKDYPEIGVIEPKDFLSAIGIDNWFRPERLNPKVESLIYWRDVKKSAVAFGGGLAVLVSLCYYSLISVVAYTSLTVLATSISLKIYQNVLQAVHKIPDSNPLKQNLLKILTHWIVTDVTETLKDYLEGDFSLSEEKCRSCAEAIVKFLNSTIAHLRRVFLIEDIADTGKFGLLMWAMTYIGSWFNGLSLLIIGYVALFTLPKVYENNKTQIDSNLEIVREKVNMLSERIRAVIPVGKKEDPKSKNE